MANYDIDIILNVIDNSDYPAELSGNDSIYRIIQNEEQKVGKSIAKQISELCNCNVEFNEFYELTENVVYVTITGTKYSLDELLDMLSKNKLDYHSYFNLVVYTNENKSEKAVPAVFDIQWETMFLKEHTETDDNFYYYSDGYYKENNYKLVERDNIFICPNCSKRALVSSDFSVPKNNSVCICHNCSDTFVAEIKNNGEINFLSCSGGI